MEASVVFIFIAGYLAIAFELRLGVNKAASALLTGLGCWLLYFLKAASPDEATELLLHLLGDIASILFFLLGAMTIVEIIDSYGGFDVITSKIKTDSKKKLLWIITWISFFLSAFLDNLTTAIVMASLSQKLLSNKEDRLWFAGMIVIAANAGGAWSPLGDVTTTMLWIGGQITAAAIIIKTFVPSLAACVFPLWFVGKRFGDARISRTEKEVANGREGTVVLIIGIGLLLFVPVFKSVTHMPPFMGMLLALAIIWIVTSVIQRKKQEADRDTVRIALQKIDAPSILFFLGILLSVAALDAFGLLKQLAAGLSQLFPGYHETAIFLGVLSAVVDNVPLVAAAQGMYDLSQYPADHNFWTFLALTTGTGGSALIIGTAAGVAIMGIEKIDFMWYLKKISWLALLGFIIGAAVFIAQEFFFS